MLVSMVSRLLQHTPTRQVPWISRGDALWLLASLSRMQTCTCICDGLEAAVMITKEIGYK